MPRFPPDLVQRLAGAARRPAPGRGGRHHQRADGSDPMATGVLPGACGTAAFTGPLAGYRWTCKAGDLVCRAKRCLCLLKKARKHRAFMNINTWPNWPIRHADLLGQHGVRPTSSSPW